MAGQKFLNASVTQDVYDEFSKICDEEQRSLSNLLNIVIKKFLSDRKNKQK